jgi:hypothetical protein
MCHVDQGHVVEMLATCLLHVADVSRRGSNDTWYNSNMDSIDTLLIAHFATTEFTMLSTRRQLHVANY